MQALSQCKKILLCLCITTSYGRLSHGKTRIFEVCMWHRCFGLYLLNNASDLPRLCSACDGNSALCFAPHAAFGPLQNCSGQFSFRHVSLLSLRDLYNKLSVALCIGCY